MSPGASTVKYLAQLTIRNHPLQHIPSISSMRTIPLQTPTRPSSPMRPSAVSTCMKLLVERRPPSRNYRPMFRALTLPPETFYLGLTSHICWACQLESGPPRISLRLAPPRMDLRDIGEYACYHWFRLSMKTKLAYASDSTMRTRSIRRQAGPKFPRPVKPTVRMEPLCVFNLVPNNYVFI